jgi:hypothetical protein
VQGVGRIGEMNFLRNMAGCELKYQTGLELNTLRTKFGTIEINGYGVWKNWNLLINRGK